MQVCAFCRMPTREPAKLEGFNQAAFAIQPDDCQAGCCRLIIPRRHGSSLMILADEELWRLVAAVAERLKRETRRQYIDISVNDRSVMDGRMQGHHQYVLVAAR